MPLPPMPPLFNAQRPPVPAEGTELAFRALVQVLRADPGTRACSVRAWEGHASDLEPPGDDSGPWIRLTPRPLPSELYTGGATGAPTYAMPFAVDVETSTPGTGIHDSMRLWGLIFAAITSPAARAAWERVAVQKVTVKQPAWGVPHSARSADSAAGVVRSYGVGSLEVSIHFTS